MNRRRRVNRGTPHHVDERWMASYMDMVTVLMCLFIVLFAMSTVDQEKYERLKESLATGFGDTPSELVDASAGMVVPEESAGETTELFSDLELARLEVQEMNALQQDLLGELDTLGLGDSVRFAMGEDGLTMRMVNSEAFFGPDSATLLDTAVQVLDRTAPVMAESGRHISVEGHTAAQPGDAPLLDWELSSERAVNVVRYLISNGGIAPTGIDGTGYAGYRPLLEGFSPEAMQANRRVDLVLHSDEPDSVRALIPRVLAEQGQ